MSQKFPSSSDILYSMISLFKKKKKSLLSGLVEGILIHFQKHEKNQWNNYTF